MAVDYTKLFTIIGSYLDKINDYYANIATIAADQDAVESVLAAQDVVRTADGLADDFSSFQEDVSAWIDTLDDRIRTILSDDVLIGANFSFGASTTVSRALEALVHDMFTGSKSVKPCATTVGSVSTTSTNTTVGTVKIGTKLDGITPPMEGAPAFIEYNGVTSQLAPTSETLTFTCVKDSNDNILRGSEEFEVTGTHAASDGYSPQGENVGNLGTITCCDNRASDFISNASFDTWADGVATDWTEIDGTAESEYTEGATVLYGDGASLKLLPSTNAFKLEYTFPSSLLTKYKSYWVGFWACKDSDSGGDINITLRIEDYESFATETIFTGPDSTDWVFRATQFVVPIDVADTIGISLAYSGLAGTEDAVYIDNLIFEPCEYMAGISPVMVSGPDKFLLGDKLVVDISNNNAGKFQTYFRKSHKVQLPSHASPTISDSLVT